jgi:predicted transporter
MKNMHISNSSKSFVKMKMSKKYSHVKLNVILKYIGVHSKQKWNQPTQISSKSVNLLAVKLNVTALNNQ